MKREWISVFVTAGLLVLAPFTNVKADPPGIIQGIVVGGDNTTSPPLSGVTVELWSPGGYPNTTYVLQATTNTAADGTYAFSGLQQVTYSSGPAPKPVYYKIIINYPGYAPYNRYAPYESPILQFLADGQTVPADEVIQDVKLLKYGIVQGVVTAGDSATNPPLSGVTVELWSPGGYPGITYVLKATATTEADGKYLFSGAQQITYSSGPAPKPVGYKVKIARPGYAPYESPVLQFLAAGQSVPVDVLTNDVNLLKYGIIHGTVADGDIGTNPPLAGATVELWSPGGYPGTVYLLRKTATTGADGSYLFSGLLQVTYSSGPAPKPVYYVVKIQNPGYENYESPVLQFLQAGQSIPDDLIAHDAALHSVGWAVEPQDTNATPGTTVTIEAQADDYSSKGTLFFDCVWYSNDVEQAGLPPGAIMTIGDDRIVKLVWTVAPDADPADVNKFEIRVKSDLLGAPKLTKTVLVTGVGP